MRYLATLLVGLSLASMPVLTGCDRTVSHSSETQTKSDGTTVQKDKTTAVDPNGNVVKTQTTTENKP